MKRTSTFRLFKLFFGVAILSAACAQQKVRVSEPIRLNQIGFYPGGSKIAVVPGDQHQDFFIATTDLKKRVFQGKLSAPRKARFSDKLTQIADFSALTDTGRFVMVVPGLENSYEFEIKPGVHSQVSKASLKAFYFQRFSTALPEEFAGMWHRPASHPDNRVLIHGSAADSNRPEGFVISSPKGWIDAGDYNKYIVNSGITMGTLLSAYEDLPEYYSGLDLHIPESKNALPDILDETLWNLRWMLTMQDPNDGGVYHKCTNARFDPMVMPHEATTPRYVVQKGTAAALDFAAVNAQAARIFRKFGKELPGLADSCLEASQRAWLWANEHPNVEYDQDAINKNHDPDILTGGYGDGNYSDEFIWAACELLATTGNMDYLQGIHLMQDGTMPIPGWNQVRLLGYYTLLRFEDKMPETLREDISKIKSAIVALANGMISKAEDHSYNTVMGIDRGNFVWGSSSVAANQGIALVNAYRISGDKRHITYALHNLDYLLGRNATGYSFLTGFGDKTPMHIHHRPSEADGISQPVPGLLAGGPNPGMQDKCKYPSSIPDEAYVDDVCSYASNEIAINWNAPLVYLVGSIEATYKQ